jgi:hypothetical protein
LSRGRQVFRQSTIEKALKAARKAGYGTARVEIKGDGSLVLIVGEPPTDKPVDGDSEVIL